jgi:hypothetical protein
MSVNSTVASRLPEVLALERMVGIVCRDRRAAGEMDLYIKDARDGPYSVN